MADAPPSGGQSFGARMSRKVGPLPVWAWAVIVLVVGYFLYKRFGTGSNAATGTSPASATVNTTPIPSSDQSGGGVGSASGSSGTQTPTTTPTDQTQTDQTNPFNQNAYQFYLPTGFPVASHPNLVFGPGGLVAPSNLAPEHARTFGAPAPSGFKAI